MTNGDEPYRAMSKREHFALELMGRLFSFDANNIRQLEAGKAPNHALAARTAVDAADAIIAALNKEKA